MGDHAMITHAIQYGSMMKGWLPTLPGHSGRQLTFSAACAHRFGLDRRAGRPSAIRLHLGADAATPLLP
jgi:hypothetical protein